MPGFSALILKNNSKHLVVPDTFSFRLSHENEMGCNTISSDFYAIQHITNKKFSKDKFLIETDDFVAGLEGVIFTLPICPADKISLADKILFLYNTFGDDFVKQLRGEFSGFIYNRTADKWLIFTNQTAEKRIFYYENADFFIFTSDLHRMSKMLSELGVKRNLNTKAAYSLLTAGFMLNDICFVEGVKRLMPGCYINLSSKGTNVVSYFNLADIEHTNDKPDKIIENVDFLFKQAIKREFEKDIEYGYKHIATLSGGLDSRMTVLMAHKMGYTDQLNFTFSQANYLDEKIAKKIAIDHKHEFMFQSLDHGNYLQPIDEIVSYNDGLILFPGSAHVLKSCKNMNFDHYGLIHTGLVGDAVLGSFLSVPGVIKPQATAGLYSSKLKNKALDYINEVQELYPSEELYKFYSRGFMGAMNGNYYFDVFTQSTSPFLDVDFLSYCYSIPENLKFKQKIYIDWIAQKNREFANYPWEKTGVSPLKSLNNKKYFEIGYYKRMSLKFFDKISGKLKSGMNPMDYWLAENEQLAQYFKNYYAENIDRIEEVELRNDCVLLFEKGNWSERMQVLTLLAAIKLHFS